MSASAETIVSVVQKLIQAEQETLLEAKESADHPDKLITAIVTAIESFFVNPQYTDVLIHDSLVEKFLTTLTSQLMTIQKKLLLLVTDELANKNASLSTLLSQIAMVLQQAISPDIKAAAEVKEQSADKKNQGMKENADHLQTEAQRLIVAINFCWRLKNKDLIYRDCDLARIYQPENNTKPEQFIEQLVNRALKAPRPTLTHRLVRIRYIMHACQKLVKEMAQVKTLQTLRETFLAYHNLMKEMVDHVQFINSLSKASELEKILLAQLQPLFKQFLAFELKRRRVIQKILFDDVSDQQMLEIQACINNSALYEALIPVLKIDLAAVSPKLRPATNLALRRGSWFEISPSRSVTPSPVLSDDSTSTWATARAQEDSAKSRPAIYHDLIAQAIVLGRR